MPEQLIAGAAEILKRATVQLRETPVAIERKERARDAFQQIRALGVGALLAGHECLVPRDFRTHGRRAEHRADADVQLTFRVGLGQIGIRAVFESFQPQSLGRTTRHHEDGNRRSARRIAQSANQLHIIEPGHHQIRNDQLGPASDYRAQGRFAVGSGLNYELGAQCVG